MVNGIHRKLNTYIKLVLHMSTLNENLICHIINTYNAPLVFRSYVNWAINQWCIEKWITTFGEKKLPFRCFKKDRISDEPCWERRCNLRDMTFKEFLSISSSSDELMYFDYKYMHKWFDPECELFKSVSWKQFGYDKGASDTTLWIGNRGAHTPAHQDTYGFNIVAQVYGRKRWILFPPEAGGLKPTRIPYEESSIYSELNFYCPSDLTAFHELSGGRMVELSAGDALFVPRGWWHFVQNVEPVNIALNIWLPHEKDVSSQVSEALVKIFVAQICKDLPDETAKIVVNPNEEDILDTPLAVLFLQLETVANVYLDNKRKARRAKRQKTTEDDPIAVDKEEYDLNSLIENKANNLELVPHITNEELVKIIKRNIQEFSSGKGTDEDDIDGSTTTLCLTKAVIDAFSQSNVIDAVKQNLFARLS